MSSSRAARLWLILSLLACVFPCRAESVPVLVSGPESCGAAAAAEELIARMGRLYPADRFELRKQAPTQGRAILLQHDPSLPAEAFRVSHDKKGPLEVGRLQAADARGFAYGLYRLLERLGCGFYLSFDTLPESPGPLSLDAWDLSARPLVRDRLVFNWHNFLSGCSTWDVPQWNDWIARSRQMGFNGVMVHAYGNNPMAGFAFQGQWKPVGFLSSTRVGRDWSVNHVNDVRRLYGGELFDGSVFGSQAAIEGTDRQRTEAAQALMSRAFAEARRLAMNVWMAVDVDTASGNPQELITRLPESARFRTGDDWLPRPDTPEGYALYKAQVAELLRVYPQISVLVAWHRTGRTLWMDFARDALPEPWQREFAEACQARPDTAKLQHAVHMFAQAKIVAAFRRALDELGRRDVRLAMGSWHFSFMPAADRFLPREVVLIGLDAGVLRNASVFDSPSDQAEILEAARHRPVLPVAWAHHDDGNYVGRPYTPYTDFHDRLAQMGCGESGFGIIHWMTRPLDLHFKSLVNQVWEDRHNEPLAETCRRMAVDCIGPQQSPAFCQYLYDWITTMPLIARETSDFFVDVPLELTAAVQSDFDRRVKRLEAIDRDKLSAAGRDWIAYYSGLERYVLDIFLNEVQLREAVKAWQEGRADEARQALAQCRPERTVEQFAQFARLNGISRGEQGLVVTMNTRWLTHFARVRQALGQEPVRIRYAATSHDLLAQSRGKYTFHFDRQKNIWETQGEAETGFHVFALPDDVALANPQKLDPSLLEVCRSGITAEGPMELTLAPIFPREKLFKGTTQLPAGQYELTLLFVTPGADKPGPRTFEVTVGPSATKAPESDVCRFEPVAARGLRIATRGNKDNAWNSICEVRIPGQSVEAKSARASAASGQDFPAAKAFDGDPATRWAAQGRDHWLECALDPARPIAEVQIQWYGGSQRQYDFDLLVTRDGEHWEKVTCRKADSAEQVRQVVDLSTKAGEPPRAASFTWPVHLDQPGALRVRLTPLEGDPLLCGAVLAPARPAK